MRFEVGRGAVHPDVHRLAHRRLGPHRGVGSGQRLRVGAHPADHDQEHEQCHGVRRDPPAAPRRGHRQRAGPAGLRSDRRHGRRLVVRRGRPGAPEVIDGCRDDEVYFLNRPSRGVVSERSHRAAILGRRGE